jgi:hypothetical protein
MQEDRKIRLGEKDYEIAPINLGTLKLIGMGSAKAQSVDRNKDAILSEERWYEGTYEVVAAGLGWFDEKEKPDVKRLLRLEGIQLPEVIAAARQIYLVTGLVVEKEGAKVKKPGEEAGAKATG